MQRLRRLWRRLLGADPPPAPTQHPSSGADLDAPARLIVGLGNPGAKYAATRHNVGFRVVERLAERHAGVWREDAALGARVCPIDIDSQTCLLVLPQDFMNRSGAAVARALARWPGLRAESDLLVIYDDLDLPTGRLRLRPKGGSGGHNGIGDVLQTLDTQAISRLRVGVGHPGRAEEVVDWVLDGFTPAEEAEVLPGVLERAAEAIEVTISDGVTVAMGRFNGNR